MTNDKLTIKEESKEKYKYVDETNTPVLLTKIYNILVDIFNKQ